MLPGRLQHFMTKIIEELLVMTMLMVLNQIRKNLDQEKSNGITNMRKIKSTLMSSKVRSSFWRIFGTV